MPKGLLRIPLTIQIGVVVALFVAALVALWTTSLWVIEREGRRVSAKGILDRAGESLADRGARVLDQSSFPDSFEYTGPHDWRLLDSKLRYESYLALRPYARVQGGYFLRDASPKFLGTAASPPGPPHKKAKKHAAEPRVQGPPKLESDLVEIHADAAIRRNQVLFVVEVVPDTVPPITVAIRTAPLRVGGRVVAATWTMRRLDDPIFYDRSTRGYRLAAGLALGGIVVALGLLVGLSRTVRNRTLERDRLQAELRRSERLAALGRLLAGVAHEVRNPLAGIRSTVQLWQRGIGPDAESFADLVAEADRLEGIVARLLHFSRADAQDLVPGDLNQVISEVARLARSQAESQAIEVEVDLDPDLPRIPMASPALVQVFRNLTANAVQAMPSGGRLLLRTHINHSQNVIVATVSDTGPGLSAEVLAHLFEPFYTTKAQGTGLGLAIAREILLAHRGELSAGNRVDGSGAVFTVRLPIVPMNQDEELSDGRSGADLGGRRR